jgi:hypothetical protein
MITVGVEVTYAADSEERDHSSMTPTCLQGQAETFTKLRACTWCGNWREEHG